MRYLLGTGVVTWQRRERVTDRYGAIFLTEIPDGPVVEMPDCYDGQKGSFIACIREARQSQHIGDLFRGLTPPKEPLPVGTEIVLGAGTLFREGLSDIAGIAVGLRPHWILTRFEKWRHDWLNPVSLYQVHNQTVDLFFESK